MSVISTFPAHVFFLQSAQRFLTLTHLHPEKVQRSQSDLNNRGFKYLPQGRQVAMVVERVQSTPYLILNLARSSSSRVGIWIYIFVVWSWQSVLRQYQLIGPVLSGWTCATCWNQLAQLQWNPVASFALPHPWLPNRDRLLLCLAL